MKYPFFVTDSLNHAWALASSKGPLIFIRPAHKDNESVYLHELEHVKQWYALTATLLLVTLALCWSLPEIQPWWPGLTLLSLLAHNGLYILSDRYRLWCEVRAYRVQAMGNPLVLVLFAEVLATRYNLRLTAADALAKLTEG